MEAVQLLSLRLRRDRTIYLYRLQIKLFTTHCPRRVQVTALLSSLLTGQVSVRILRALDTTTHGRRSAFTRFSVQKVLLMACFLVFSFGKLYC